MPKAISLYGPLPDQLAIRTRSRPGCSEILAVRETHGIATGFLLDVPDVPQKSMLVLVNRLAIGAIQVTVLNFAEQPRSAAR